MISFAFLFVAAFLIRFTAPVVLVYASALAYGRWSGTWRHFPSSRSSLRSAARYFASYQAFFWVFFLCAATTLIAPRLGRLRGRTVAMASAAAALMLIGLASVRLTRVVGTANPGAAVSLSRAPQYFRGVSGPFRDLGDFLDTLPKDRSYLIGATAPRGPLDSNLRSEVLRAI
ncbi:MAG: hypothetical protein ABJC63_00525 [Gemmatimonadales bacterium]